MSRADQKRSDDPSARVTVITGGSEGIGESLAHKFAADGHRLLLVARSSVNLEKVAQILRASHRASVDILALDLAAPDGPARVEQKVSDLELEVLYLVNNAGIGLASDYVRQDIDDINQLIDLNVRALSELTRRFLPGMLKRGRGGILNISSLGGMVPGPYQAAYYASKAYVNSLSRALQSEVRGSGVKISVVTPGPVATRFHSKMGAQNAYYLKALGQMTPRRVANSAYKGFLRGQFLIAPGFTGLINVVALKLLPHAILAPPLGYFLKRRLARRH